MSCPLAVLKPRKERENIKKLHFKHQIGRTIMQSTKGVVHFKKKKTFADNLLTPMSSKMSMSFFLQSKRN